MFCGPILTLLAAAAPAGDAQMISATYAATPNARQGWPRVRALTLTLDAAELKHDGPVAWRMDAVTTGGRTFTVHAVTRGAPLAPGQPEELDFLEYAFQPEGQPALQYVNTETGGALLPRYAFRRHFIPRSAPNASVDPHGLARSCDYLGHAFLLTRVEKLPERPPVPETRRIELDPGLLIGTSRNFREEPLGRIEGPEDYDYVRFERHEYDAMREAGINYLVVDETQRAWILDQPFFYICARLGSIQVPEEFYRSNYWGWVNFMDEPAVLLFADPRVSPHIVDIRDVPTAMRARARADYRRSPATGDLTRFELPASLPDGGIAPLRLYATDVPYWETIISAGHYLLAEGGSGIVHEGRYQLDAAERDWRRLIGDGIEPTSEELLHMEIAWLRGPARNFDREWGIAIYGQADPALSPRAVTLAYDLGARYLWFWTSDHDHHLPYLEQLELARIIRDHAEANPRRPRRELLREADTVIAMPEGYVYEVFQLWKFPGLEVDNLNHVGVSHRAVLRRVLGEALIALRRGETVDLTVDDRDFAPRGYRRVVRVGYDATATETRTDDAPTVASVKPTLEVVPLSAAPTVDPGDAPVVSADYRATPPTIDGRLDDWQDATWYPLKVDEAAARALSGTSDLSARCAFAYDHETLYVAVDVKDDAHAQPHRGFLIWGGDSVQVGFDPLFTRSPDGYAPDDSEFGVALHDDGQVETVWWFLPQRTGVGDRDAMRSAVVREGTRTVYEIAVPAETLGWSPFLTDRCGIAVSVNDLDESVTDPEKLAADIEGTLNMRKAVIELVDALAHRKRPDLFAVLELAPPPADRRPDLACLLSRGRNAVEVGEPVELELHANARRAVEVTVEVILRHEAGADGRVRTELTLPPGRSVNRLELRDTESRPGFYELQARVLHDGRVIAERTMEAMFW